MSDEAGKKKIIGIRTFADDVRRAKNAQHIEETPVPPKPEPTPQKPIDPPQAPPPKESPVKSAEPELPLENPPFHFIRASSPNETTFHDEVTIPDKRTLQKETVRKTAPVERPTIPIEGLGVDTDEIEDQMQSVLSSHDAVFDAEEAEMGIGGGSIVTDRKREKFRFFPAIVAAFREWFATKASEIKQAHTPKKVIEKSSARKQTINEAATQTKRAPGDDYAGVVKRLKNVERVSEPEEMQIKKASAIPIPTWSHIEDETVQDKVTESLEEAVNAGDDTSDIDVHAEERAVEVAQPPTQQQKVILDIPEVTPATPTPTSDEAPSLVSQENEPDLETSPTKEAGGYAAYREKYGKDFSPVEDVFLPEVTPPPAKSEGSVDTPKFAQAAIPDYRLNRAGQPIQKKPGTPYLTLIAVILVATILGVGVSVWWFTRTSEINETNVSQKNISLVTSQHSNIIQLPNTRAAFHTALREAVQSSTGVTDFTIMVGETFALPAEILQTLELSASGNFLRNITGIAFGAKDTEPFIVIKVESFDSAFGGLLSWESAMQSDLSPLFGTPTITTVTDERIQNRDIRVLHDQTNTPVLVYGFVNKQTVIIAPDRETFTALAGIVQ